MEHTWVDVKSVIVHERRKRHLGDLNKLKKSIQDNDLADPIVVTRDMLLLSGWRRLAVYQLLKRKLIPAYIVDSSRKAVDIMLKEMANPEFTKPMTWSEQIAQALDVEAADFHLHHLVRLNANRRIREKTTGKDYGAVEVSPPNTADTVAELFGVSRQTWGRARQVYLVAEKEQESGVEGIGTVALRDLNRFGQPARAYKILRELVPIPEASKLTEVAPPVDISLSANEQRTLLNRTDAALGGILYALRDLRQVHPDLAPEELTKHVRILLSHRRNLDQVIKALRKADAHEQV